MKKILIFLFILLPFLVTVTNAFAITDPLQAPNNMYGVHILFPSELDAAAKLINSSGGDWGYVTIPIQSGDKNIVKWQSFMDHARDLHIIPILRLATEGDYFNTSVWRKPNFDDILDFANFLDSLNWPTVNRYIIVYNEPNRADEWGGKADPQEYATILSYAVTAFKTKNPNFFIISAGLDNAAATSDTSYNEYTFLTQMNQSVPGIFNQIDGEGSHSYANPAFAQPPTLQSSENIMSFTYENNLISSFTQKKLPIFITETGWSRNVVSDALISSYYTTAFSTVWKDNRIVTVTPFLLEAGGGPFEMFSLLKSDGSDTPESTTLKNLQKVKGAPALNPTPVNPQVLGTTTFLNSLQSLPLKKFPSMKSTSFGNGQFLSNIKVVAKYLLGIQ